MVNGCKIIIDCWGHKSLLNGVGFGSGLGLLLGQWKATSAFSLSSCDAVIPRSSLGSQPSRASHSQLQKDPTTKINDLFWVAARKLLLSGVF